MDYSPLNYFVWVLFFVFVAIVWGAVWLFWSQNPDYPGDIPDKLE